MSRDNNDCKMDQELAEFGYDPVEILNMGFKEKDDLISTLHRSLIQSDSPNQRKVSTPKLAPTSPIDELRLRLEKTEVSITSLTDNSNVDDDSDEVVVLNEFESPHCSTSRQPRFRSFPSGKSRSPAVGNYRSTPTSRVTPSPKTPTSRLTPTANSGTSVKARKKIVLAETTKEQVDHPVTPEADERREVMPSHDYVNRRAEIYALNPFNCVDTALSTLAETSSSPKKKKASVPFFYSEHALSLKMDDYIALFVRKFGFSSVPLAPVIPDEVEEIVKETPNVIEPTFYDEFSDFPPLEESTSNSKYNLRHRTATKRANDFEFTVSDDDDDYDHIIPSKKLHCNERDSPKEDAKATVAKTRTNKLSLLAAKSAAERSAKSCDELVTVDSDNSSDMDVPGREVCVPKLQYSAVVTDDASKWKTSKSKVSALPKGHDNMVEAIDAMDEMNSVKPRQTRAKPTGTIKPGPISGRIRRGALAEESALRKSARGRQANKKQPENDTYNEQEEQIPKVYPCPLCKEEFSLAEIQEHVNACCDESTYQSVEGECPVCFKNFPRTDLPDHSSSCNGKSEDFDMDQS